MVTPQNSNTHMPVRGASQAGEAGLDTHSLQRLPGAHASSLRKHMRSALTANDPHASFTLRSFGDGEATPGRSPAAKKDAYIEYPGNGATFPGRPGTPIRGRIDFTDSPGHGFPGAGALFPGQPRPPVRGVVSVVQDVYVDFLRNLERAKKQRMSEAQRLLRARSCFLVLCLVCL
jgi:hypothetical protein